MDYLDIIVKGFIDENTRRFYANYLYREYKKAENYNAAEFFTGLNEVAKSFENNLKSQREKIKLETLEALEYFQSKGNTEKAKELKNRANNLKLEDYRVNLWLATNGKYTGDIGFQGIQFIKQSINEAWKMTQTQTKPQPLEMDYLDIIVKGIFYHKDYFVDFLKREYNKAEGYSVDEFIQGLKNELRLLKDNISSQKREDEKPILKLLETETDQDKINEAKQDLKELRLQDYYVNLPLYTNFRYEKGVIRLEDINFVTDQLLYIKPILQIQNLKKNLPKVAENIHNRFDPEKRRESFLYKPSQQKNKPPKPQPKLQDFFNNTDESVISEIQETFKDGSDKEIAMLIGILKSKEIVTIIENDKKGRSRNSFVKALTGKKRSMQYINRTLMGNFSLYESDTVYNYVLKKIETILK